MKRLFQTAACLLVLAFLWAPLAQAGRICQILPRTGHCSNCPMPQTLQHSEILAQATSKQPCCRISAARPFPTLALRPAAANTIAPSVVTVTFSGRSPRIVDTETADSACPPFALAQARLCTFLI